MMYLILKEFTTPLRRFRVGEERHESEFEGSHLHIDDLVEREFIEPVLHHLDADAEDTGRHASRRRAVHRPVGAAKSENNESNDD